MKPIRLDRYKKTRLESVLTWIVAILFAWGILCTCLWLSAVKRANNALYDKSSCAACWAVLSDKGYKVKKYKR